MLNNSNNLGQLGEETAVKYLESKGFLILDRNFKNNLGRRLGEIDIIAKDKAENEIVFVEVKTRDIEKYGETLPEENITYSKLRKLSKIAEAYLRLKHLEDYAFRFDAVSVWLNPATKEAKIKHIPNL